MTEKERKRVMDWLSPINQADIHAAASRKHEPGTGEWFLEGEVFRNWRQDSATSLWLFGDGKPKTQCPTDTVQLMTSQLDAGKPFFFHPLLTSLRTKNG
jgi:hypothetical protein